MADTSSSLTFVDKTLPAISADWLNTIDAFYFDLLGGVETLPELRQQLGGVLQDLDTLGPSTADGEFLVATAAGVLAWESGGTARASLGLDAGGAGDIWVEKAGDTMTGDLTTTNVYATVATGPALLNEASATTNPTVLPNRADVTTGVGGGANTVSLIVGGFEKLRATSSNITFINPLEALNSDGPAIMNEASSTVNPTLCPNKKETDTGWGWGSDEIWGIVGGVRTAYVSSGAFTVENDINLQPSFISRSYAISGNFAPQVIMRRSGGSAAVPAATPDAQIIGNILWDGLDTNDAYALFGSIVATIGTNAAGGAPTTLTFSLGDTGATAASVLSMDIGGIYAADAAGPAILNEAATTTNPTLIPNRAESDTGWGWASDELWAVLGGVAQFRIASDDAAEFTVYNYAADATKGPILTLHRARGGSAGGGGAAGVANDVLGGIEISGYDDAGTPNVVDYAAIRADITDPTTTAEKGALRLSVMGQSAAGTLGTVLELYATGQGASATGTWNAGSEDFHANNAAGPALLNEAATSTNPTLIPNRAETDTGWGWASDVLYAVVGGAATAWIGDKNITVDDHDGAGSSNLNFAASGSTEFILRYQTSTDTFRVNENGIGAAVIFYGAASATPNIAEFVYMIQAANAAGPAILNEAATATNPTLCPNKAELDTGIGWAGANIGTLVAGGARIMSWSAAGFGSNNAAGPVIVEEAATTTNPTLCPNQAELDTGWGWASDELWAVLGGVAQFRIASDDADEMSLFNYAADGTAGPIFKLIRARGGSAGGGGAAGVANDVLGRINFEGYDDNATPNLEQYAAIVADLIDPTDTAEIGAMRFDVKGAETAGTLATMLEMYGVGHGGSSTGIWSLGSDGFYPNNAAGPEILNEAATTTNPTLCPNKAEPDTGWGWASDVLWSVTGGAQGFGISNTQLIAANAAGPALMNEAATTTNPTLVPNRAETDTGIGWSSDSLSIIGGGTRHAWFTDAGAQLGEVPTGFTAGAIRTVTDSLIDDTASSFASGLSNAALVVIGVGTASGVDVGGLVMVQTVAGSTIVKVVGHANLEVSTSVLTGTTGTDGKFTVGWNSDTFYFENRLATTALVSATIIGI